MGGSGTRQEATQASCGTAANSDPWVPFASILWALTSGQGIWGVLEASSSVFSKLCWGHFARLAMPVIAFCGFNSYKSLPPLPAVYFFASENTKFWLILAHFILSRIYAVFGVVIQA